MIVLARDSRSDVCVSDFIGSLFFRSRSARWALLLASHSLLAKPMMCTHCPFCSGVVAVATSGWTTHAACVRRVAKAPPGRCLLRPQPAKGHSQLWTMDAFHHVGVCQHCIMSRFALASPAFGKPAVGMFQALGAPMTFVTRSNGHLNLLLGFGRLIWIAPWRT